LPTDHSQRHITDLPMEYDSRNNCSHKNDMCPVTDFVHYICNIRYTDKKPFIVSQMTEGHSQPYRRRQCHPSLDAWTFYWRPEK